MPNKIIVLLKQFYLPLTIVLVATLFQATDLKNVLDFERALIDNGQWWLLLTGHLSHLDWQHWLLNNAALLIIWELFYRPYSMVLAFGEFLLLALAVSLGIYFFNPDVQWYVGLSGILHGMFAIGILREAFAKNILSIVVAIIFVAKIVWEQTVGLTTGLLFDADEVLVDAHLYGAIGGLVMALVYSFRRRLM